MWATTRDNLRAHPRAVYARLEGLLNRSSEPAQREESFYGEWGAAALYGVLSGRAEAACPVVATETGESGCRRNQSFSPWPSPQLWLRSARRRRVEGRSLPGWSLVPASAPDEYVLPV